MKRAILMLFIASLLAGCKSQTPTVDPFFGRTTVPTAFNWFMRRPQSRPLLFTYYPRNHRLRFNQLAI